MNAFHEPDRDLSPVGALALLWPAVPDCLVSPERREGLEIAAGRLAPIARIALELRLGEGQDEVDLHQYISSSAADVAVLKRHLSGRGGSGAEADPSRHFLRAWADDQTGARGAFDGFFLEWDRPGGCDGRSPAIFLPVQARHGQTADPVVQRSAVVEHLHRLGLAGGRAADLLLAVPAECSISYVGAMLGRGPAMRVNLRGIRPADLGAALVDLGWPGNIEQAEERFDLLVDLTGQVAVALDFAPTIQPTIGFEAALPDFPSKEPRWRELFDKLCLDGLCTQDKRAALEDIGARLYPEGAGQDWPAAWIAATLAAPPPCVPWFERRLSHVKVTISGSGEVAAKAYVSAQHYWYRDVALERARAPIVTVGDAPNALSYASDRAAKFILAERQQDDFWRDFRLVNGASDEWVTAFVGHALAMSGERLPDALLPQTVAALLKRQRSDGGWGFNRISPADADSTVWALKFLGLAGYAGPEVARATMFLTSHLRPEGGISTYAEGTSLRFRGMAEPPEDAGWRSAHSCVAANAAALVGAPLVQHLIASQDPSGAWRAYWWRDDSFATALAIESLGEVDSATKGRALAWARERAASARGAFDRAWLVRILAKGGPAEQARARAMAAALAAEQRPDGGWDASAEMLFPDPSERHRQPDLRIILDDSRIFTTASVLLALSAAQVLGTGS